MLKQISEIDELVIDGKHYALQDANIELHKSHSQIQNVGGELKKVDETILLEITGDVNSVMIE